MRLCGYGHLLMRTRLQLLRCPEGIHLPIAQGIAHEVVEPGKDARKNEACPFILINLQYNNRNVHGIALAMRKNTNIFRVNWKAIKGVLPHSGLEVSF